jgi:TctA family transporter
MLLSDGSFSIFFTLPIDARGIIIIFLILILSVIPGFRRRKEAIHVEELA